MSLFRAARATPKVYAHLIMDPVDKTPLLADTEHGPVTGTIYIVSFDSPEFQAAVKEMGKSGDLKDVVFGYDNDEKTQAKRLKLLAATIVGWEDNGFFAKPYSKEAAIELVSDPELRWFVQGQLLPALADRENFFGTASTN